MLYKLKEVLVNRFHFHNEEIEAFEVALEEIEYKKGEHIFKPNMHFDSVFIIESGVCMSYLYDLEGNQVILEFFCEGWWMTDINSLYSDKPTMFYLEVLEDIKAYSIKIEDIKALRKLHSNIDTFFQKMLVDFALHQKERYIHRIILSAEARYEEFLKFYPTVSARVNQKFIASFLGVTPQFFSRMKARMYKEKKSNSSDLL